MKKTVRALMFFSFLAICGFSNQALGAVWFVDTSTGLNSAITNSVSGDTITITSDIVMISSISTVSNKTITIQSDGSGHILNGDRYGGLNIFGGNISIDGISFENMSAAITNSSNSSLRIGDGTSFSSNTSVTYGGAIFNTTYSTATIGNGVYFSSNVSDLGGGAISNFNSSMTIGTDAGFSSNTGRYGGAIFNNNKAAMTIEDGAVFTSNKAGNYGGAVYNANAIFTIGAGAVFSSNTSGGNGGAIGNNNSIMTIGSGEEFSLNTAETNGGAIFNSNSSTMIIGNAASFSSNTAGGSGGAIYSNNNSTVTIGDGAVFSSNTSVNGGGAIMNSYNSDMTIGKGTIFSSNTALGTSRVGGAIYNLTNSTITIGDGAAFLSNTAKAGGGAVFNSGSVMAIGDKADFSFNTTDTNGGAINNYINAIMTIGDNALFLSNTAKGSGTISNERNSILEIGNNATFLSNTANAGGAINNNNAIMTIGSGAEFSSNTANANGGGIYNIGSVLEIGNNATFLSNTAGNSGGAIYNMPLGNLTPSVITIGEHALFSSNTANSGGAIYSNNNSTVTIGDNAVFSSNKGRSSGGGVYNSNNSVVEIGNNAIFSDNMAGFSGGAINNYMSVIKISEGVTFSSNSAINSGGAIYNTNNSTITIAGGVEFSSNTVNFYGGAIYNYSSKMQIEDGATFSSNTSGNIGGALYNTLSDMEIGKNAVFSSNTANRYGGAIYNSASAMKIGEGAVFSNNTVNRYGGAIYNYSKSTMTIGDEVVFSSNTSRENGGVMANDGALLEIGNNAVFSSNTADADGGVIYAYYTSTMTIGYRALFSSNSAGGNGGVIFSTDKSAMEIEDGAVFSSNTAGNSGGAIYNIEGSTMRVGDTAEFSYNTAISSGGAIFNSFSTLEIGEGAVFSSNKAVAGAAMYLSDGIVNIINPVFTGNEAVTFGGAVYMEGSSSGKSELNISVSTEVEGSGNKAGGVDNVFYLAQNADLNLEIETGATMTLKDGMVSEEDNTAITKTGDGLLVLESENNRIDGIFNIFGGEVQAAKSIGSGNIYFDNSALLHIKGDMELGNEIKAKSGGVQDITIETDENATLTLKGIMGAGSETFTKNGSGNIVFDTASSANLVKTKLTSGTMRILTENYVSNESDVAEGATLSGIGKIKGNVINNGTVRPGGESNIGTLTIDGDYTENGILGIRLYQDEVPTNDSLLVSGNADIDNASQIDLDLRSGFQIENKKYTVLTASSGVSGIYGGFTLDFSSLDISISSDDNNVYLEVKGALTDYNSSLTGLSHNQSEVAGEIDKITSGTDIDAKNSFSKIIGTAEMLNDDGKKAVFDEIAGNIYANMLYASVDNSGRRQVYNQIQEKINRNLDREEQTPCTYNLWGQVYGSHIRRDTDSNSLNKFKDNSVYAMIGWDNYCGKENMILGYMAQFGKHKGKQGDDEFEMNDYKGGIYFGAFGERWNFKSSLSGGYQQYEVERVQKLLQTQTEAEYDGYSISAAADLYYKVYESEKGNFGLSPFGGLEGSFVHTESFTEKAKGNAASWLDVKANNFMIADAKLGLRADSSNKLSKLGWYAELSGKCNLTGRRGTFKAKINGFDDEVEIYGLKNEIISAKLEAGLDVKLGKHFDVFVIGIGEQAKNFGKYSGHLGVNYGW